MPDPDTGTSRPEDTYCARCDVFGHAPRSPACEVYQEEVEKPYTQRQLEGKVRDAPSLRSSSLMLDELYD